MEEIQIGDIVRLFCEQIPQDKFYVVLDIACDIEREPPMYKLFCINTGDDAGWQYEYHTTSKLYRFKKIDKSLFLW